MGDSYSAGYRAGEEWASDTASDEQLVRLAVFMNQPREVKEGRLRSAIEVCGILSGFTGLLVLIYGMTEPGNVHNVADEPAFNAMINEKSDSEDQTEYISGFTQGAMRTKGVLVRR